MHAAQAVHSGADLQSAAEGVLGYRQASMKGKAVRVDPIPGLGEGALRPLLRHALAAAQQPTQVRTRLSVYVCPWNPSTVLTRATEWQILVQATSRTQSEDAADGAGVELGQNRKASRQQEG